MANEFSSQLIKVLKSKNGQAVEQSSFVGGQPKLAASVELPICKNCGAAQTFFFQVAFPEGHPWSGLTLAVFECTACILDAVPIPRVNKVLVPSMKRMDLRPGEDLPKGALDLYQKTCRFLVSPTAEGVVRNDYPERVQYRPIAFEPAPSEKPTTKKSKIGGKPGWVTIDDETPGKYLGQPLDFLMQWQHDFQFDLVPGAPAPYHPDMEFVPELKQVKRCLLYQGTQLYFFGNQAEGRPHVFMLAIVP